MLLRRLNDHLKSQNWAAVVLDFIVVVIGIFLAFQIERWYASERDAANACERLSVLSDDLFKNREILEDQILLREEQIESAGILLQLDTRNANEIGPDEFYKLLATVSNITTPRFQRGAYDLLISTGQLDLIRLPELKSALAEFYARVDEFLIYNQGSWSAYRNTFEPYIINNLDLAALLRRIHPDDFESTDPSYEPKQFATVIGDGVFEGVIVQKRHAIVDERNRLLGLLENARKIENLLSGSGSS